MTSRRPVTTFRRRVTVGERTPLDGGEGRRSSRASGVGHERIAQRPDASRRRDLIAGAWTLLALISLFLACLAFRGAGPFA
jgi:hypothetical protein